jgi:hypothetical protein
VSQRPPAQWSDAQSAGDAWPAPTVGRGHRTVRCAPDSVRCANCHKSATVVYARIGKRSRTRHEQWLSGGAPDYPVHHPTEGKDSLPCWPPTAPTCLGAIKRTPYAHGGVTQAHSKHSKTSSPHFHAIVHRS